MGHSDRGPPPAETIHLRVLRSSELDEVHRFNRAQQDVLLPLIEEGLLVLIGATTENPYFEVNAPLLSRSSLFRLEPLGADAIRTLVARGLQVEEATAEATAVDHLVDRADGDARVALNALEVGVALASNRTMPAGGFAAPDGAPSERRASGSEADARPAGPSSSERRGPSRRRPSGPGTSTHITLADAEAALSARALRYERDEHYDIVSAFIKSVRGSDPDAGLYWLARMLEAGEDARFIARRLVILASEDVGMSDPIGLLVADAAARAVEFVGLPEAQLNLAQAVVHLATAPKSNRVYAALSRARSDVADRPAGVVPSHLRDASYRAARSLGHGAGYDYPHDDPRGWVPQEYRPPEVAGRIYYEPSELGAEREVAERMRRRERGKPGDDNGGTP